MTIQQIRKAAKAESFKPFAMSSTDGRPFRVRHPGLILTPPEASRTFVVAGSGEDYSIIDLLLVTSIDCGNDRNGPRRRGARGR
jgi:hypothetical protein